MTRRLTPYAELADILNRLGPLVSDARRARGLDQKTAATRAGIAPSTLCRLEARGRDVSLPSAVKLLRWLDTTTVQPTIGGRT